MENLSNGADIEQSILSFLAVDGSIIEDSYEFARSFSFDHQLVVGAIKSLLVDRYVAEESITVTFWSLTEEGDEISAKGSPEYQVFISVPAEGISLEALQQVVPPAVVKIGLGACMKNKWLKKQGDLILKSVDSVVDETMDLLKKLSLENSLSEDDLKNLKRRKLVQQITRKSYRVSRGPDYRPKRVRKMADLTREMLGNKNEVSFLIISYLYSSIRKGNLIFFVDSFVSR